MLPSDGWPTYYEALLRYLLIVPLPIFGTEVLLESQLNVMLLWCQDIGLASGWRSNSSDNLGVSKQPFGNLGKTVRKNLELPEKKFLTTILVPILKKYLNEIQICAKPQENDGSLQPNVLVCLVWNHYLQFWMIGVQMWPVEKTLVVYLIPNDWHNVKIYISFSHLMLHKQAKANKL